MSTRAIRAPRRVSQLSGSLRDSLHRLLVAEAPSTRYARIFQRAVFENVEAETKRWQELARNLSPTSPDARLTVAQDWCRSCATAGLGCARLQDYVLDAADARSIVDQLKDLRRTQTNADQFIVSLFLETRLVVWTWHDLMRHLEGATSTAQSIRDWGNRHHREGGPCDFQNAVGNTAEKAAFVRFLGIGLTRAQRTQLFDDLIHPHHWRRGVVSARAAGKYLGGETMWGTFGETPGEGPFDFLGGGPFNARELREALGLDGDPSNYRRAKMVAFEYNLAPSEAVFPTVADAARAAPWNYYFRAADAYANHGQTQSWPGAAKAGRPEIVHRQVAVSEMSREIRMSR